MNTARLDYADIPIELAVESEMERNIRIRSCAKEPETLNWLRSLSPGVFVDVGANIGAYSLVAATMGHRVWAIEPHPATYEHLKFNIEHNGLDVTALPYLLSDHDGWTQMTWSSDEAGSALHKTGEGQDMACTTLDTICERYLIKPDYLKVDTDGSEYEVLVGASHILEGVSSLQVELDASVPNHVFMIGGFLGDLGFVQKCRTWHGTSSISNAVYER